MSERVMREQKVWGTTWSVYRIVRRTLGRAH
jgi:hypothetical protein